MDTEILDLAKEGVSFLLTANDDDKLESSELTISLDKVVKDVKDFIELRADIFLQKEEKIQQYQQDQLRKLETEEQYYQNKCKAVENNLGDCVKQLKDAEHSFFDVTKKLAKEEELNKKLKDEMSSLTTEKDDLKERYWRTHSLYSKVIQWYEDFLKIHIDVNKEDPIQITFHFNTEKCKLAPYIKFEVTDDFMFKILDTHAELEGDKENFQDIYTTQQVISLIYESLQKLKMRS